MRDFSRRTEKIAICRGEWEISRSVAENVKNRDLSRRIGNFAVSYMPRNPFVPGTGGEHVMQSGNWRVARDTVWELEGCT